MGQAEQAVPEAHAIRHKLAVTVGLVATEDQAAAEATAGLAGRADRAAM